jgi:amino acid transporter
MPANAIIADAAVNIALLVLFDNTLAILVASNLGYVLAHILALTGVLLLRKDRPDAVRPIRLASYWLPIAAILAVLNIIFLVVGNLNLGEIGYAGTDKLFGISVEFWYGVLILLISLVLWGYRRKIEDKQPAAAGPR